jgi:TolB-like protein/Tfp pilus assembly protein PilF
MAHPTMTPSETPETLRFGEFELDVAAYELRRRGRAVRLERRPMDLLILLVERRRQLVTRADIVDRLWGPGVFVDVEMGINTAVRKVRQALRDPVEAPLFVETVAGKGYRFVAEVTAAAAPAAASSRVTVAVLPFENLGVDPDRQYLADGLTEETIAVLGQIDPEHIGVIARTSVRAYKRTTTALDQIGRELRVGYLVESSIRAEGARLRITSKLVRVADQVQMWAASYDSEPSSMLAFQRELSGAIAEQIRLRLSPARLSALERRQTRHPEAYDLYLRGRFFWNHLTPPTTRRAIEHYTQATRLDPDYALAWSGIADAYVASPINGDAPPREVLPRAREAAEHAVRAEPQLAEAQASLGMVLFWQDMDAPAGIAALRRAIELDPAYELAHRMLGVVLAHAGRLAEAAAPLRRARELEPLNPMSHALSSHGAFLARDYRGALPFARQAIVVDPEFWIGHFLLAQAAEQLGEDDLAFEELAHAARLSGGNSKALALRGYLLARRGRTREAREVLETLEAASGARYVPPVAMALVNAGLGDRDAAMAWLERAGDARDVHLVYLPMDPKWDALRSDARFSAFLERCGLGSWSAAGPNAAPPPLG